MTCPAIAVLETFLNERLPRAETSRLTGHIERCQTCQLKLKKLADADGPVWTPPPPSTLNLNPFLKNLANNSESFLTPKSSPDTSRETARPPIDRDAVPGYELIEELGHGGMAVVYKARHAKLDRFVALKLILSGTHASHEEIARFRAEAETVAQLRHQNIVQIYDIGEIDGRLYLSLEYVEGGSLSRLTRDGAVTPLQAARLVETLARTMHHCHQQEIIHRDLKPANILLERVCDEERKAGGIFSTDSSPNPSLSSFLPKITDFGLAKRLDDPLGLTRTGVIAGTPAYMAPEQVTGKADSIGPAADIYALGVILYEVLIGRTPFHADTPMDTIMQALHAEPVSMKRLRPNVPRDLETIAFKCLEKDPARRYVSCLELAEDLRRFQAGEPIKARPPSLYYRLVRSAQRNWAIVGGIAATLIALVCGTLVSILFAVGEGQARRLADENARQADAARQAAERETYQARLAAAQVALAEHDLVEAKRHLDSAPPDLRGWEWQHLHARLSEESPTTVTIPDRHGKIYDLLNHGRFALTFKDENVHKRQDSTLSSQECCLVDVRNGNVLRTYPEFTRIIIANTSNGYILLVKGLNTSWTLEDDTGRARPCPLAFEGLPDRASVSPDGSRMAVSLLLPAGGRLLRFYNLATGEPCRPDWKGAPILQLAFSPDGRTVAGACDDGKVRLWDIASGHDSELLGSATGLRCLAFSPDGTRLAAGGLDSILREWEPMSGRLLATRRGHYGFINVVEYSGDGRWLASGGDDFNVHLWSTDSGQGHIALRGINERVFKVAFSPDGSNIVASAGERVLRWPLPTQDDSRVLHAHTSYVYPVAFSPNGEWFASGGWDDTIRLWDTARRQPAGAIPKLGGFVASLAISPDGKLLAALDGNGRVTIWEKASLRKVAEILGPQLGMRAYVYTMAFSPDSRVLVWGGPGNQVRRWDSRTGQVLANLTLPTDQIRLVAFSPDGNELAVGGDAADVLIVSPDTGAVRCTLPGLEKNMQFLAFSPDGRRFVTAENNRQLRLWDATSFAHVARATPVLTLQGHTQTIFAAAFHPGGMRLASGGRDRAIHIWDLATGEELIRLPGHSNYIFSLAFSPDGRTLLSGSGDYTVRIWDTVVARSQELSDH